jgi:hypothetical protein
MENLKFISLSVDQDMCNGNQSYVDKLNWHDMKDINELKY